MCASSVETLPRVTLGDDDLLSRMFFPKPVILVSTVAADGTPNLAPYSQVFPRLVDGKVGLQLVCRASSNTAANVAATGVVTLNFIPDDALLMSNAKLLAIPGTTAEKMARNHFTLVPGSDGMPPRIAEADQVLECRWSGASRQSCRENDNCFVLSVDGLFMSPRWQQMLDAGVSSPPMPVDFGLRRPGAKWRSHPLRQTYRPQLRPRFTAHAGLAPESVLARFARALDVPEGAVRGSVRGQHVQLGMSDEVRHIGSPQMELEVFADGAGSRIEGRIGPNPHIWTLFLALHAVVGFSGIAGIFWGLSQWMMDQTPWALLSLPIALLLHLFVAGAAFIGQGLGADQTYQMRAFMDDMLSEPPALE